MKVLFVGNWNELNGWGVQQINSLLALDSAQVEVVPRRLRITGVDNPDIPKRILEMEKESDRNPDIVLLNTLPSMYERGSSAKHVGYYVCETNNFKATGWASKVNLMDSAINCCFSNKESSLRSGVKVPIHIVPQAIDINKFSKEYPIHEVKKQNPDSFIFYTIGELTQRKNVGAILRAFYTEFLNENVILYVKTTPAGLGDQPHRTVEDLINKVKGGLKLYQDHSRYKREFFDVKFSSEEEISSIHQSCECFVNSSRGEAFCLPLADAMLAGNSIVSPNHTGMDYVNEKNSFLVHSYESDCFGAVDTLKDIYRGDESWYEVSIRDLRKQMRNAYEKRDLAKKKSQQAKKDMEKFSYNSVGDKYKKVLEKI